jgi:hypothetical protein
METPNYELHYPELSEEGKKRTKEIVDKFRKQIEEIASDTLVQFADTMASEIVDDDAWISFRSKVIEGLCGYGDPEKKMAGTYNGQWWQKIRSKILEENREQIVNDIIADKEYEIKQLKETIELLQKYR